MRIYRDWHEAKDSLGGPTYSGSLSWLNFLEIVESRLVSYGAVDLVQNEWTYERWLTSEWPDDSSWSRKPRK